MRVGKEEENKRRGKDGREEKRGQDWPTYSSRFMKSKALKPS